MNNQLFLSLSLSIKYISSVKSIAFDVWIMFAQDLYLIKLLFIVVELDVSTTTEVSICIGIASQFSKSDQWQAHAQHTTWSATVLLLLWLLLLMMVFKWTFSQFLHCQVQCTYCTDALDALNCMRVWCSFFFFFIWKRQAPFRRRRVHWNNQEWKRNSNGKIGTNVMTL